jgi:hypothetical protein
MKLFTFGCEGSTFDECPSLYSQQNESLLSQQTSHAQQEETARAG